MALNSSCSKAIVDMLGTHVPKFAAPLVSNTSKFSLSPNDKKGCNFGFPKLVQNKGLVPLHAVPPKTTEELDNLMLQPQEQEQPKEAKMINVKFRLNCTCKVGEQFLVVGNHPLFGSWDPANAIPMTWSEENGWNVEMNVPAGKFQFKFILKNSEGDIVWQPGPDRIVHTWEAMDKITVCEDWENAELQSVTTTDDEVLKTMEEDQPTPSNKAEKMPNLAENLGRPKEKTKSTVSKAMKEKC